MRVIIFGGTTEGRMAARELSASGAQVTVSVATGIGGEAMGLDSRGDSLSPFENREGSAEDITFEAPDIRLLTGRRDRDGLCELVSRFDACIDATHPYAKEITENLEVVCRKKGIPLYRLLREQSAGLSQLYKEGLKSAVTVVSSTREAVSFLSGKSGSILLTTGAKELLEYSSLQGERLIARVLPACESIEACLKAGIPRKNIIAAWGPFSKEFNAAIIRQFDVAYMVTKESGREGGFPEKLYAAEETGCHAVVIKRPEEEGFTISEIIRRLHEGG